MFRLNDFEVKMWQIETEKSVHYLINFIIWSKVDTQTKDLIFGAPQVDVILLVILTFDIRLDFQFYIFLEFQGIKATFADIYLSTK